MDGLPGEKIIENVKFQHLYLTMNEKSTKNCFILKLASNAVQGFKIINLGNYEIDVKQLTVFYITNMMLFLLTWYFWLNSKYFLFCYAPTLQCHIQLIKILNIITDLK